MIRKFDSADTDAVINIWEAASREATPFLSEDFLTTERANIASVWLKVAQTWVYEESGVLAGFMSLIGNEVGGIFVHPAYQGRGIGRAMIDHAVSLRGDLFLDVFEENRIGRRFYKSYGFKLETKHPHKQTGHMQLRLVYQPSNKPRP